MTRRARLAISIACVVAAGLIGPLLADDWPTYKMDAERTGATPERLTFPLVEKWVYQPSRGPRPAWPEPGKELHRMDFDYAFQPVVSEGLVYFGSSADDTLRALDAATGSLVWRFTAGGPIRFAPAIAHGNVYLAADDGWVSCIAARTGRLVWRFRAAPGDDRILGNGRLISRWPCRSGPAVVDDIVYCTAGMWPAEGVYVYALNAATGREVWCNDGSGAIYVDLPHPGASGFSGVAPQGYLLVHGDTLLVTTGRCVPAAFDRRTGRLLYYKPAEALYHGGAWVTSGGDLYFNPKNRFQNPSQAFVGEAQPVGADGMFAYSFASGEREFTLPGKYRVLISDGTVYAVGGGNIQALDLDAVRKSKRITQRSVKWTTAYAPRVYCLALAGGTLLVGSVDSIAAFDAATGKRVWHAKADGQVRGLAVSDGRLVASTNKGRLLCFEHGAPSTGAKQIAEAVSSISASSEQKRTAARLVEQSGKSKGYALVIGEPDSRLAAAIAAQTDLQVINVLPQASNLPADRERLLKAGLYGSRVWLQVPADLAHLPDPPYWADLVVVSGPVENLAPGECYRVLHPCGGVLCFVGLSEAQRARFIREAGIPPDEVSEAGGIITRGKLPGAGQWRYPWADGGRSGVGNERRVRLPLELLWFGGPGPDRLMDRHLMTSPPVAANGRVFMTGQHDVLAFDAYNGRELWTRHMPNVGRKYSQYYSSGLVADDHRVYIAYGDQCQCLDQLTGKTLRVYKIPEPVTAGTPPPRVPRYMDVAWPETWQVIGPFPKGKPPLSPDDLKRVSDRFTVNGREYRAVPVKVTGHVLDFTNLYGGYGFKPLAPDEQPAARPRQGKRPNLALAGQIAYAFAKINCPRAGKLLIGAGADWWMQWYLDGRPVFDTLKGGNEPAQHNYFSRRTCSTTDYLFDLDVTAGEHVLAVMVKSGSRGWSLASASMGKDADKVMSVVSDDENLPDLEHLVWGYLSVADDLVLGSYTVPIAPGQPPESHLIWRSESEAVFALNKGDGSLRWVFRPSPGRTVSNIEIAFGDGRLFLLDATSKADCVRARRRGKHLDAKATLVALNLEDGRTLWRQDDVPILPDRRQPTRIKSNPTHLFMGLPNWGHLVYARGVVVVGANAAYDAATGKKLWQSNVRPQKLPIVLGDWLISHPYAYDLRTGRQRMTVDTLTGQEIPWRYTRAYGCGPVNGCQHLLFFRSGADGFFDLDAQGTTNFGGVRPNCARSIIAAEGLLIHPEGYSGCCCSYNYQTSLAMVPASEPRDTWYVFPGGAMTGPIKHIAVNFGAPGDRRDGRGTAWLGFPRPMMANACPAPVTVLMQEASCYYHARATDSIKSTDAPWVYSSGLQGEGRISIPLTLQPEIFIPPAEAGPTVDGNLDEACWQAAGGVPFENTPFTLLGASVDLRILRDAKYLYFAYHRKRLSNPPTEADEETLGRSDAFEIYLTDRKRRHGIRLALKRNGKGFATFGTVDRYRKTDPSWKGEWQFAVRHSPDEWTAEVAVPVSTLTQSGLDAGNLRLNCMSRSLTSSGLEAIFLTDPVYGADFKRCVKFRNVASRSPKPPEERSFTLRLHFAETAGTAAGRRVFDVAVQGRTVIEGLDIVREAGGRNIALIKEIKGLRARDSLVLELIRRQGKAPIISGLEMSEETE